ncbi:hypothetical protein JCM10213_007035 [Rhodosporidiobolus nylandii]
MSAINPGNNLSHTGLACVTGASGFVGAAVALEFLRRGHSVRLPLRKQEQADEWLAKYGKEYEGKIQAIVLEKEMSEDGAFDKAVEGCEVVVHTASPATFDIEVSPEEDILKPALRGTLSLLESAKRASSVKSVVITSSVAAYISVSDLASAGPEVKLTEDRWNRISYEEASRMAREKGPDIYSASKAAAEKAALDFAKQSGVKFALSTCAPSYTLGFNPAPEVKSLKGTRSSFGILLDFLWDKTAFPPRDHDAFRPEMFVSIDDVARAHVDAALNPSKSNGHRYILVTIRSSWEQVVRCMIKHQPALEPHFPPLPDKESVEEKPQSKYTWEADRVTKDFGWQYQPLETFVKPYAQQVYNLAKADGVL